MFLLKWAILLTLIVQQAAWARCSSELFDELSVTTLNQSYPPLSSANLAFNNSVDTQALIRGRSIFSKAGELMLKARKHIYIQTWSFEGDSESAKIIAYYLQKLAAQKAKNKEKGPVQVWFMINITDLENMLVEKTKVDNYIKRYGLNNDHVKLNIGIFNARLLGANHAKSISIDERYAVITGANMTKYNNGIGFYDLGFVVKGDIVKAINHDFREIWNNLVTSSFKFVTMDNLDELKLSDKSKKCLPLLFARSQPHSAFTRKPQVNSTNTALLKSTRLASQTIDIITPSLNSTTFMESLAQALKRKVKIRVVLSKGYEAFNQNIITRGGDNLRNVARLYRSLGIYASRRYLCHYLDIRWYSEDGVKPVVGTKVPANHAKFMQVDGQVTYFGSVNMDNQSWNNSREIALFLDSTVHARHYQQSIFNPVFNRAIKVEECSGFAKDTPKVSHSK